MAFTVDDLEVEKLRGMIGFGDFAGEEIFVVLVVRSDFFMDEAIILVVAIVAFLERVRRGRNDGLCEVLAWLALAVFGRDRWCEAGGRSVSRDQWHNVRRIRVRDKCGVTLVAFSFAAASVQYLIVVVELFKAVRLSISISRDDRRGRKRMGRIENWLISDSMRVDDGSGSTVEKIVR